MSNIKVKGERLKVKGFFYLLSIFIFQFSISGCTPDAEWHVDDVEISMHVRTISAGFIGCDFSTSREAYYLIAIQPVDSTIDPLAQPKQFMTLALDSAYIKYLDWRHDQLTKGEFHVAPFSSHSLQYGSIEHDFTGLWFDTDYWIYAFVVNPETMKPVGKLHIQKVHTEYESIMPIYFEYRVMGNWDYIYPFDSLTGLLTTHFPYVAITMDSLEIESNIADSESLFYDVTPVQNYFDLWLHYQSAHPAEAHVRYGVQATENDGIDTRLYFKEGHTYYTFIGGYDFSNRQNTLYKFTWEGEKTYLYFDQSDNIAWDHLDD